jgi:RNA polymerase sigma factor (sigma-70 family)
LITAYRQGDREKLWQEAIKFLARKRYLFAELPWLDQDSILQEVALVFIKAVEREGQEIQQPAAWLRTVLGNHIKKAIRDRKPTEDPSLLDDVPVEATTPSERAIRNEEWDTWKKIGTPTTREAFVAWQTGKATVEELAAQKGITPKALRRRFDRLLEEARELAG